MDYALTGRMLRQYGSAVTLRRLTTGAPVDVVCMARVDQFQPQEMVGGITQGDRKVILSNDEIAAKSWPGPPRKGDQLITPGGRTTTVQAAATIYVKSAPVRHDLQVRGG
jgi:hypothetical protein